MKSFRRCCLVTIRRLYRATPVPPLLPRGESYAGILPASSFICFHRNCKTAASLGRRLCLLRILRQSTQSSTFVGKNAARLCCQFINSASITARSILLHCLPQVSAAFHELHLGSIAASFQQRFQFIYRQPKSPLKLFIYIVCAEHFLLTSVRSRSPQRVVLP